MYLDKTTHVYLPLNGKYMTHRVSYHIVMDMSMEANRGIRHKEVIRAKLNAAGIVPELRRSEYLNVESFIFYFPAQWTEMNITRLFESIRKDTECMFWRTTPEMMRDYKKWELVE